MNEQSQTDGQLEVPVQEQSKPAVVLNSDGIHVGVNQQVLDYHGYDRDEFLGLHIEELVVEDKINAGINLQKIIEGDEIQIELNIQCESCSSCVAKTTGYPIEYQGETYAEVVTESIEEKGDSKAKKEIDESNFNDINATELENIVKNIRVDAPSGEMPLSAIMLDLTVGHNEIEQYKQGSLSLHNAIDERLQKEEKRNPDSPECDVLKEVKKAAFGLYLRLQRGDAELHGDRDGKYSGYFN